MAQSIDIREQIALARQGVDQRGQQPPLNIREQIALARQGRPLSQVSQPPSRTRRFAPTTTPTQDEDPSVWRRARDVAGAGVGSLFRGLRAPQQALIYGPALATARAREEGRLPTPGELWRGGAEAVRKDVAGRDVVEEYGLTGGRATAAGLALDLVADPLWILTPAKLAKASGIPALLKSAPAQRGLQAVAESRPGQLAQKYVVDPVGKRLVTDYGKPKEYVEFAERRFRESSVAAEEAVDIGKRIGKLPSAEQRTITQYMEAGSKKRQRAVLAQASKRGEDTQRLGTLADEAIGRDIALGQALVDAGIMTPKTFQKWKGRHIRREYVKYEDPLEYFTQLAKKGADPEDLAVLDQAARNAGMKGVSSKSAREGILKRKVMGKGRIPEAAHDELIRIMEAAHPVAKGELLSGQLVALRRFLADTTKKFGKNKHEPGFAQVPDVKAAGPAAGKWFPQAIADDLNQGMTKPGKMMQKWRTGVGWWKYGKVVLSPGTHARNVMSNYMLASMAGLSPFRPQRYVQAMRSLKNKDEYFREAKAAGTFLQDTFAAAELPKLLDISDDLSGLQKGLMATFRKIGQQPSNLYQAEERLFKMAMYIDKRKAGVLPKAAAAFAEEALFNYRRVPEFIDQIRRTGVVPFITFSYKAIPATARALWQRPATVNRIGNVFRTFEDRTPEGHDARQLLPEYMREGWMKLPGTDEKGRPQYFNMNYILPFGDLGEMATGSGFGGRGGPAAGLINSPLVNTAAALATGIDPFTNQQIDEQFGGVSGYISRLILPSLLGGAGTTELVHAYKGLPSNPFSIRAEPRDLTKAALANFLGVRITAVDLPQQYQYRLLDINREMRDVQTRVRRWRTAQQKGIDPKRVKSELTKLSERYAEIILKYAELRNRVVPSPEPPDVNETEGSEAAPFQ
jgi:hypothetical protein